MSVTDIRAGDATAAVPGSTQRRIDAGAHPQFRHPDDIRDHMPKPWRDRAFPGPHRYLYPHPGVEAEPRADGDGLPGSDPEELAAATLGGAEDLVVLLPLTRGMLPDVDLSAQVCAATNRWLTQTWLGDHNAHGRFRGTIRVDPRDPDSAVREIRQWADHPFVVQVAVPQKAQSPYGKRAYWPIWKAAAEAGLPVAVHADDGVGVDAWPTPAGYVSHYVEYAALHPFNFSYHLTSLIAEGAVEEFPDLVFVFADGGIDYLRQYMWRLDKFWRGTRDDTPWVRRPPSEYLREHFRFLTHRSEIPREPDRVAAWLDIADAGHLLMYAGNYPLTDRMSSAALCANAPEQLLERVLWGNAAALYLPPAA